MGHPAACRRQPGQGPAVAELDRGATSIWLRFGGDGAFDEPSLERVLDGVHFDIAPIVLDAGSQWLAAARGLRVLWERQDVDRSVVGGSFGADPFGDWADHRDATRLDADLRALADEAGAFSTEHPTMRVATIDGTRFHDAGASDAQELGLALAGVVATLRTLTAGGLDVASALGQLEVRLAATSSNSPRSPSSVPLVACWHVSPRSPTSRLPQAACRCTPSRHGRW